MTLREWCVENNRLDILDEWDCEKNLDITPDDVAPCGHKKFWWKGKCGHSWDDSTAHRTRGRGCPICASKRVIAGINDLAHTHPEIAAQWHPAKNKLTPQQITAGSNKKVWWRCEHGHEWEAVVYSRAGAGKGCPCCSGNKVLVGFNDLTTTHPDLTKEWHPTKNKQLTPNNVSFGSNKKAWWQCSKGHEWQSTINSRVQGCGCPICESENKTSFAENAIFFYIQQLFPDAVKSYKAKWLGRMEIDIFIPSLMIGIEYDGGNWHDDVKKDMRKNNVCAQNNVHLIRIREPNCPNIASEHIKLETTTTAYLEKSIATLLIDCLNCADNIDIDIERDKSLIRDTVDHIERANSLIAYNPNLAQEWHRTKNGNLKPEHVSFKSNKKVWWHCAKGHEWEDSVNHRSSGRSCPYCSNKRLLPGYNDLATTNPTLASEWHKEKNDDLTASDVLAGSGKKAWWECKTCGHEWEANIASRNRGCGCPECGKLKSKAAKDKIAQDFAAKHEGETMMMNCGMKATIIAYRTSHDIDVEFEDGKIAEHKKYSRFQAGSIGYPKTT